MFHSSGSLSVKERENHEVSTHDKVFHVVGIQKKKMDTQEKGGQKRYLAL
jgi:hypothetical protein